MIGWMGRTDSMGLVLGLGDVSGDHVVIQIHKVHVIVDETVEI